MRASPVLALVLVLSLAGCGEGCGGSEPVGNIDPSDGQRDPAEAGTAVIEGTLRLADGAELAQYPESPTVGGPGRPALPEACTPPQQSDRVPVQEASGGGLTGVLVALADFDRHVDHEPETHRLTIEDCRLTPRLVVATRGDTLVLRNDTDYPFMPDLGTGMLQGLLHEEERELELGQGGVRTLMCGFAAPCGRAEIVTLYHPLHTISDARGHYRIEGVPAGEELRVNAWHPLYQEANETVTLRSGETRTIDLVLSPAEIQAPPSDQGTTHEGHPEDDPNVPIF